MGAAVVTADDAVVRASPRVQDFDAFYGAHWQGVVGVALALTGGVAAAEDVAQEAFLRAHDRWGQVAEHPNPAAWVRRVAINLATSRLRRLRSEARALARLGGRRAHDAGAIDATDARFWREVRSLPRRQAQAVALHYVDDLSVEDVAATMGCAVNTAKVHLHRARASLADRLAGWEDAT
ncbi:MAG TPA: SigE family RNA polymerase sigma factor [Nitriliruptorales bacterium]